MFIINIFKRAKSKYCDGFTTNNGLYKFIQNGYLYMRTMKEFYTDQAESSHVWISPQLVNVKPMFASLYILIYLSTSKAIFWIKFNCKQNTFLRDHHCFTISASVYRVYVHLIPLLHLKNKMISSLFVLYNFFPSHISLQGQAVTL